MKPEDMKTIHRVISIFGKENQKMQAVEELIELQSALFENIHRGTNNRENIVEEIADVELMLVQLKDIFEISPKEIENVQDAKLHRLNHTIEKYLAKQKSASNLNRVMIDRETSNGR